MANTRKPSTAARKAMVDLALAPLGLNLDELEREGEVPPLFTFTSGGQQYVMRDPYEMSADEVDTLVNFGGDLPTAFTVLMGADAADAFLPAVPLWKLNAVVEAYFGHYGITAEQLRRIAGNAAGSPR